jgi:predicted GIY-YIG superfamily endonuclease
MEVTIEFLAAGASEAGGHTRRQVELLGLNWPLSKGWKQSIIGSTISDEIGEEFLSLVGTGRRQTKNRTEDSHALNWCGAPNATDIYLYVLALEGGCYYVGLTTDVNRRMDQHFSEVGSEWTKLHKPLRRIHCINTGTQDGRKAESLEDEVTISLMMTHSIEKVRGGHFCQLETAYLEPVLRAKGAWDRIKQFEYQRIPTASDRSWSDACDHFLGEALSYYDSDSRDEVQRDRLFSAVYALTRYRYWKEEYSPGLNWAFWHPKGVLPVLLSFKLGRPVASRLSCSYEVLAAALCRGRGGKHPLRRLFLLAWQAYQPSITDNQAKTVERFMEYLGGPEEPDRQYDELVSVLFPEMRSLVRS